MEQKRFPNYDINFLFLGDSHIQNSLDTDYFHNSLNYAKSGEPYSSTFWKLKHILKQPNASIDTVIVGFAHHNLALQKGAFSNGVGVSKNFERTYAIHRFSKYDSIDIDYFKYFNVLFRKLALKPTKMHYQYSGKFAAINEELPERIFYKDIMADSNYQHYHFYQNKLERQIPKDLRYMDSIINLCKQKKIYLVIVSVPTSKKYRDGIPSNYINAFEIFKRRFNKKKIHVLDYSNLALSDTLFSDFDHLNINGAKLFTKLIRNRINSN